MPNHRYTRPHNWEELEEKRIKELYFFVAERKRILDACKVLVRARGEVLRELRINQGMLIRDLSSSSDVSLSHLRALESGQTEASPEILQSILGSLGVPPSQFSAKVEKKTPEILETMEELKSRRNKLTKAIKYNKRSSVEAKIKKSQYRAEYTEKNKEKIRKANKAWRESSEGREYMKSYKKAWYYKNPDITIRRVTRRRAQRKENGYEFYSLDDAISLYGKVCHLCGQDIDMSFPRKVGAEGWTKSLQLDHVIPISKGGPDTLENVRPAHAQCNMNRNTKTVEEYQTFSNKLTT